MYQENGFALLVALLFLFALTIMVVAQIESSVSETKIQWRMQYHDAIWYRAEAGLIQLENSLLGVSIRLPDSPILLKTVFKEQGVDSHGHKIIEIDSTASWHGQMVVLRSRDIFARVPVPAYQRLWWQET